jgi:hypothetical protein
MVSRGFLDILPELVRDKCAARAHPTVVTGRRDACLQDAHG